jgi:hypothetical protein
MSVSPGYFAALGVVPSRGRDFSAGSVADDTAVIVNERFAMLHFPRADPVGQRLAVAATQGTPQWLTVVGVVPDIRQRLGQPAAVPIAYTALLAAAPAAATLFIRGTGDGASLTAVVRESLRQLDSLVPLDRARSLALATRDATWSQRVSATLAVTVSVSAFVLAVAGLYAVVSHRTARRRREIGLRMALGADAAHIARLVVSTVGGSVALGLVLGLLGVAAWDRAFAPAGPEGRALNPASLAAAVAALLVTVVLGCLLPAGRATRIAPGEALRRE